MPYTILITMTFQSIVHAVFFGWLFYRLNSKQPLALGYDYDLPTATAPMYIEHNKYKTRIQIANFMTLKAAHPKSNPGPCWSTIVNCDKMKVKSEIQIEIVTIRKYSQYLYGIVCSDFIL